MNNILLKEIKTEQERMLLAKMYSSYLDELAQYSIVLRDKLYCGDKTLMIYEEATKQNNRKDYFIMSDLEICGFVLIGKYPNSFSSADIYIQEFYIEKEYRKQGIGIKAVELIQDKFKKDISLFVLKQNLPAVAFWKKVFQKMNYHDRALLGGIDSKSIETNWHYYAPN